MKFELIEPLDAEVVLSPQNINLYTGEVLKAQAGDLLVSGPSTDRPVAVFAAAVWPRFLRVAGVKHVSPDPEIRTNEPVEASKADRPVEDRKEGHGYRPL